MIRLRIMVLMCTLTVTALPSNAGNVRVTVDDSAARAVVDAVQNPNLNLGQALTIARLPGNQGPVRKAKSYGRPAGDDLFARALVAAAHHEASYHDPSEFNFPDVRDNAFRIRPVLAALSSPSLHLPDKAKARIALFTPQSVSGTATGYIVAGGTSGGFAFESRLST